MPLRRFPDGFLWGTASAAHQVEGDNRNSDWWEFEQEPGRIANGDSSAVACDHYHRYREDIASIAALGLGAYRFSVEWSRIEPEEGEFSRAALDHYRRMLDTCHEHGLVPMTEIIGSFATVNDDMSSTKQRNPPYRHLV